MPWILKSYQRLGPKVREIFKRYQVAHWPWYMRPEPAPRKRMPSSSLLRGDETTTVPSAGHPWNALLPEPVLVARVHPRVVGLPSQNSLTGMPREHAMQVAFIALQQLRLLRDNVF